MSIRWASDVNPIFGDCRASSTILWRFVDTLSGFRCIRRSSFQRSHDPTPRFPPRGPPVWRGSRASREGLPSLRYYQGAATSRRPSRFTSFSFVRRFRQCVRAASLPPALRTHPAGGPGLLGFGQPLPICFSTETTGSPKFLENPYCTFAGLFDPGRTTASDRLRDAVTRPPLRKRQGLLHCGFRGSIPRLWCSLSTLRPGGRPPRTQDSLPAAGQALPDGLSPAGFRREVSECFLTSHPPLPSLLGAIPHSGHRSSVASGSVGCCGITIGRRHEGKSVIRRFAIRGFSVSREKCPPRKLF
jgi:hypothetical protein